MPCEIEEPDGRAGDALPTPIAGVREAIQRKREVIDAAAAVFARMGYPGASMRDIAEQAAIRQASIYYYFRSKEAALEEVCLVVTGAVLDDARRIHAQRGSASARLVAMIRHQLVRMNEMPDHARVFLTQRHLLKGAARDRIRQLTDECERILIAVIGDGVGRGEFRRDPAPEDMALAVQGLCQAAWLWQGTVPGMTDERAIRIVAPMLLDGVRGMGAPLPGEAAPPMIRGRLSAGFAARQGRG